jgi:hypothetical protein
MSSHVGTGLGGGGGVLGGGGGGGAGGGGAGGGAGGGKRTCFSEATNPTTLPAPSVTTRMKNERGSICMAALPLGPIVGQEKRNKGSLVSRS